MRFWLRLLSARLNCGWIWALVSWLVVWLDGWLVASFSQRCTNKLARRNLLHQRCQMPLQLPHLLYKLIEAVRFQSILLWYNHFSCHPTFHSSLHNPSGFQIFLPMFSPILFVGFSRLCLREYCIEVLRSAYNTLVRQVRRVLERNAGSSSHDDSYLLWAIRFFMEFNRLSGLQLQLVR